MKEQKFRDSPDSATVRQRKHIEKKEATRERAEREGRAFKDSIIGGQKLRVIKFSYFWDLSIRRNRMVDHITVHLNKRVPPFILEQCVKKAIEGVEQ